MTYIRPLPADDLIAVELFNRAASAIQTSHERGETIAELNASRAHDLDAIAILSEAKQSLEEQLEELRRLYNGALDDLYAVRADLNASQSLNNEAAATISRLSDDLARVSTERDNYRDMYVETRNERDAANTSLAEAEGKLARFRDILGIPHPAPAVVVEPSPEPTPIQPDLCEELPYTPPAPVEVVSETPVLSSPAPVVYLHYKEAEPEVAPLEYSNTAFSSGYTF